MSELARLLLFMAIAGSAVTFLGSAAIWFMDEDRRIRRALRNVLKGEPEAVVLAHGRGRGAGFTFATGLAAVSWDSGAWCLVYRIDEIMGAELLVDGQVVGRVFRGENRRAVDQVAPQSVHVVTLRLVFDDPRHPDFDLNLWAPGDDQRRESRSPADAMQEANRWLARCEAIVRRPQAPRSPAPVVQVAPAKVVSATPVEPAPPPAPRPAPRPAQTARPAPAAPPPPAELDDDFDDFDDETDDELPFDDPPWDPDPPVRTRPAPGAPTYKPVSKAARESSSNQDDLPFDLDD